MDRVRRKLISLAALAALPVRAGDADAAVPLSESEPRLSGPLEMPLRGGVDRNVRILPDHDPAVGHMADWTGWHGDTWEDGQAEDGYATTVFTVVEGHEVMPATPGVVTEVVDHAPVDDPVGNRLEITWVEEAGEDDVTWVTRYWPLAEGVSDLVSLGDEVSTDQVVAYSAGAESEGGGHMQFEVLRDGRVVDPWLEAWWDDPFVGLDGLFLTGDDAPLFAGRDDAAERVGALRRDWQYLATASTGGWFRLWRPDAWGALVEARNERGGPGEQEGYSESGGPWEDVAGGSGAPGAVGVGSRGSAEAGEATFVPRIPGDGEYRVSLSWGPGASAVDVPVTVRHADGEDEHRVTQVGGGLGTASEPRIVLASPYLDEGDVSELAGLYIYGNADCAPGLDLDGPEAIYRLDTATDGDLSVTLEADPGADLHLLVLTDLDHAACEAADGAAVSLPAAPAGTRWFVVEAPLDTAGSSHPGPYTLRVEYAGAPTGASAGPARNGDAWTSLGTWRFEAGRDAGRGAVVIGSDPALASPGGPLRVSADAVRFDRIDPPLPVWGRESDGLTSNRAIKGPGFVGIQAEDVVPAHASYDAGSEVVDRLPQGQRFFADIQWQGWYRLLVPGRDDGAWVRGGYLFVYAEPGEEDPSDFDDLPPIVEPPGGDGDACGGCGTGGPGRVPAAALSATVLAAVLAGGRRRGLPVAPLRDQN